MNVNIKKIKFKQPKYILPAVLYIPVMCTIYFSTDAITTQVKPISSLSETNYLNPDLPEARVDDGLGSKRDNMISAFGDVKDITAVETADGDSVKGKEDYESRYSDKEATTVKQNIDELEQLREMQRKLKQTVADAKSSKSRKEDLVLPISNEERMLERRLRGRDMDDVEESLRRIRNRSRYGTNSGSEEDNEDGYNEDGYNENEKGSNTSRSYLRSGKNKGKGKGNNKDTEDGREQETSVAEVKKLDQDKSSHFNTVSENTPASALISAIIDENIKAKEGSRVRLRLLDDVEIAGNKVRKGTYLYVTMSGFSSQRVKGKITSIFLGDEIVMIDLSLYDTDGLEGLYVPESSFRETVKDVGSSALGQSMTIDGTSSGSSLSQWAGQAMQQAYQRTSQSISKAIKKNKVRLKYGTKVYLINSSQLKKTKNNGKTAGK